MTNNVQLQSPRLCPFKTLLQPSSLAQWGLGIYLAEKRAAVTGAVPGPGGLALRPEAPHPGGTADSGDTRGPCTGWCSFWKEGR